MSSFAQLFKAVDEETISTLDMSEIKRIAEILSREGFRRRPGGAARCLKEWVSKNPKRTVSYLFCWGKCNIGVLDEFGNRDYLSTPVNYNYLPKGAERKKEIKKRREFAMQKLSVMILFHVKNRTN